MECGGGWVMMMMMMVTLPLVVPVESVHYSKALEQLGIKKEILKIA